MKICLKYYFLPFRSHIYRGVVESLPIGHKSGHTKVNILAPVGCKRGLFLVFTLIDVNGLNRLVVGAFNLQSALEKH